MLCRQIHHPAVFLRSLSNYVIKYPLGKFGMRLVIPFLIELRRIQTKRNNANLNLKRGINLI
jgi:hypothetical protein